MSEVLQANIFFVITSIAVVVLTVLLCYVLYHVIGILKNVRDITDRVKRGSEQLAEDAQAVRTFVHEGIIGTARNFFGGSSTQKKGAKRTKKSDVLEEDTE